MNAEIITINQETFFNKNKADNYIDLLLTITRKTRNNIQNMNARLNSIKNQDSDEKENLQNEINGQILNWSQKIKKLGLVPLSLWRVQFPSEEGNHLTWEFPQDETQLFP